MFSIVINKYTNVTECLYKHILQCSLLEGIQTDSLNLKH